MRAISLMFAITALTSSLSAQSTTDEADVRKTVTAFYAAFNSHDWDEAMEFASPEWSHINPFGGRTLNREETLADLKRVHGTFLKDVTDTVESMEVRFATAETAVTTVVSRTSTYTTPDGEVHADERQIRTFVVAKKSGRWRIVQDQNTIIPASQSTRAPGTPYSDSDVMIELERTSCFGSCPIYRLTILGDGTVKYVGQGYVQVKGAAQGKITRAQVEELVNGLLRMRFFDLPPSFEESEVVNLETDGKYHAAIQMMVDVPSTILSLQLADRKHRIEFYDSVPADLRELAGKIDSVTRSVRWVGKSQ